MTISERIEAGRRERRVLTRVSRAAWRLEQAERERTWALALARAEGISIRTLATAAGLSPARVHQIVYADPGLRTSEKLPAGQAGDVPAWRESVRRIRSLHPDRVHFCHHTEIVHS